MKPAECTHFLKRKRKGKGKKKERRKGKGQDISGRSKAFKSKTR